MPSDLIRGWKTGFPSRQTRNVCAAIMLKQTDEIMIRFNLIGS
jgi:hypothetical protein